MTSLRYCTWSTKDKEWRWRKLRGPGALDEKGRKVFLHVGRIPYFSIHGENKELFFLRSILINRPCRSFADARTVEGITYQTYKEACVALNLFVDDNEQERVMEEVVGLKSAPLVRQCFVSLLVFCEPANCLQLFERFVRWMGDDFALWSNEHRLPDLSEANRSRVLKALQDLLAEHGRYLDQFNLRPCLAAPLAWWREGGVVLDQAGDGVRPGPADQAGRGHGGVPLHGTGKDLL